MATLGNDGMKYAGDDAQGTDKSKVIAKKLNETMDVVGGADKSNYFDNNIGVNGNRCLSWLIVQKKWTWLHRFLNNRRYCS